MALSNLPNLTPKLLKTYETIVSPVNGKISVKEREEIGTLINIDGLSQSGGTLVDVWDNILGEVKKHHASNNLQTNLKLKNINILILGLGGGTVVKITKNYWPMAKIIGVEIDPIMVELGEEYLGLNKKDVEIVIADAFEFIKTRKHKSIKKAKYDLILVDIYLGRNIPEKFDQEDFLKSVKTLLTKNGVVVCNRVNLPENEARNRILFQRLSKLFPRVTPHFVNENLALICFREAMS